MLSKRYESTEVDRRTWLHVPSKSDLKWCIHLSKSLFLYHFERIIRLLNDIFCEPISHRLNLRPDSLNLQTLISLESAMRNHSNQFEMPELHSLAEKSPRKKACVKIHIVLHVIKIYN